MVSKYVNSVHHWEEKALYTSTQMQWNRSLDFSSLHKIYICMLWHLLFLMNISVNFVLFYLINILYYFTRLQYINILPSYAFFPFLSGHFESLRYNFFLNFRKMHRLFLVTLCNIQFMLHLFPPFELSSHNWISLYSVVCFFSFCQSGNEL